MLRWQRGILLLASLLFATACAKKEKEGDSAKAKLAMTNATGANFTGELTGEGMMPTVFGLRVVSVLLQPESRSCKNTPCPTIWASPLCHSKDLEDELDGKTYKYAGAPECPDGVDIPFLDLLQPTDVVNQTLNSQGRPLLPGDYAYVTIFTCNPGDTASLEFKTEDMPEVARPESCNEIVSTMNPVSIGEGESVTVNLTYEISNFIMGDDYTFDPEVDGDKSTFVHEKDGIRRVLLLPNDFFKLSFEKN